MATLSVISVEPYSPGDECASVKLSSGKGEVVAFCLPCSLNIGDVVENRLSTLEGQAQAAYFSDWPDDEIEALSTEAAFKESVVLVFEEKEVLGFAALYGNQLRAMFVRRNVRGKGVGKALLDAARSVSTEMVLKSRSQTSVPKDFTPGTAL